MSEWDRKDSKWVDYLEWLPDVGTLQLPLNWDEEDKDHLINIGLTDHINHDETNMNNDWMVVKNFIEKNRNHFITPDEDLGN